MTKGDRNYKDIKQELDGVITELQDDKTDIDGVIKLYQKGQALISELEQYIKTAENKIKEIKPKKIK